MKSAFSTIVTPTNIMTMSSGSDKFNSPSAVNKIANWQAALIQSNGKNPIEFHITGVKQDIGDSNTAGPVINGLQMVPVVEFLQPKVDKADAPLNYGPLPAGKYALMYVHGAVDTGTSSPQYSGGWYKLTHSTNDTAVAPKIMKINYPEMSRYTEGKSSSSAYSGKLFEFTHEGGYITLCFEDIPNHYTDNKPISLVTPNPELPYIGSGAAYKSPTQVEPIAPIFALISLDTLAPSAEEDLTINPVIFYPSSGKMPDTGLSAVLVTDYSGPYQIYYTLSTSALPGLEPIDPPQPGNFNNAIGAGVTASNQSLVYTGPLVITKPTKIKAVVYDTTLQRYSYLTSVYYS